jgi:hypothetical protein
MGILKIETKGSFGESFKQFSARTYGHAHAVAEAIKYLSGEVLPEAINNDHECRDDNQFPEEGFRKP